MKIKFLGILVFLLIQSCDSQPEKINGVSFVASPEAINNMHIQPVIDIHANYAAIMPFGFIKNLAHPDIVFNTDRQWFGETRAGAKQYIETLKKKQIHIMLKPQLWVWRGEFTGFIEMKNEADWQRLEQAYSKFILDFAQLAETCQVHLFCIGTELETFIDNRPQYWSDLITEIRKIYKGKLTYAANWDEFKRTPFWSELDYIGVDAYFPVSSTKTPTIAEYLEGWKPHKETIKTVSEKNKKPVLFTEFGYRSVDYSGKEPWKSDRSMNQVNLEAQNNTMTALFETFWKENHWFAGGFVWKWFHNHNEVGGLNNFMFTPQNKPVEAVIKKYYSLHLQKYLNWQKIKDQFKDVTQWIKTVLTISLQNPHALKTYRNIQKDYLKIYKTSLI